MKRNQQSILVKIISVSIFMAACLFSLAAFSNTALADDVTLAWDANSETNLAGYKLYYENENDIEFYSGTDANEGDSPIAISLLSLRDSDSPAYTISGLEEGTFYYFALTAFDEDGMESDFSDEVGVMVEKEDSGAGGGGSGCFIACGLENCNKTVGIVVVVLLLCLAILRFPADLLVPSAIQNKKSRG